MPPTDPTARLAVLLSGSGRTLLNLLDRIEDGTLAATVPLVIASRECPGAQRARERGVPTVLVVRGEIPAERLGAILAEHRIDWVVLAGYLKLVHIPPDFRGRVVNIHPALLPDFGGAFRPHRVGLHGPPLRRGVRPWSDHPAEDLPGPARRHTPDARRPRL
jgi:folate-dependent phosphoribosylglycinamide formyltransferase PurN